MDKENYIYIYIYTHTHTHTHIYVCIYLYMCIYIFIFIYIITQSQKRIKLLPFAATWMDMEGIMLSEISQTEKDKYVYVFTFMWYLKNKTNE